MQCDWIVVAMSARQADHALRTAIGIGWDVTLVAAGPAIMEQAEARGLMVGSVEPL